MQMFTGWEALLIDVANQYGKDKLLFEERIQWATDNLNKLESLASEAETKPLYMKAVMAVRKAQQGLPSGHLVGFDGVCSGVQIMSALTGCEAGADNTGLINPNKRADAYAATTDTMNQILGGGVEVSRKDAKRALMTSCYGSKATPKEVFGEDTPELNAFYQAMMIVAPGAWQLLQVLLESWNPYALFHSWKLPDGFDAKVKVMTKQETRIEVDELDHASFTYQYYVNEGTKKGLSNVANVVHSVDAYVLRTMHRRCNYDATVVNAAYGTMLREIEVRKLGYTRNAVDYETKLGYYIQQWERSTVADVVILPYITLENVGQLPNDLLNKLMELVKGMLKYKPFPLVTIHDEFKCHPNNVNYMRWQYKEILADLADSLLLDDLLTQIYQTKVSFDKLSPNLGDKIRKATYALC